MQCKEICIANKLLILSSKHHPQRSNFEYFKFKIHKKPKPNISREITSVCRRALAVSACDQRPRRIWLVLCCVAPVISGELVLAQLVLKYLFLISNSQTPHKLQLKKNILKKHFQKKNISKNTSNNRNGHTFCRCAACRCSTSK